jgi:hypothetical protein
MEGGRHLPAKGAGRESWLALRVSVSGTIQRDEPLEDLPTGGGLN